MAQVAEQVVEHGERTFTVRVFRDADGEYVARIFDERGERSEEYQLWIAPYASTHPTAEEAMTEAVAAVHWGLAAE